jgi:hypothetical protein
MVVLSEVRRTDEVSAMAEDVKRIFEGCSYVEISYLLRAHIYDFLAGLDLLQVPEQGNDELRATARRLCDISREIRFASGYPDRLSAELKHVIDRMFKCASTRLMDSADLEIRQYRKNITSRTK